MYASRTDQFRIWFPTPLFLNLAMLNNITIYFILLFSGYYADPENCRWFFACLDHGTSPLTAYEFRCPFGLGFDAARLKCDWPWLVPNCGNIGRYEAEAHGFSAAVLTGKNFAEMFIMNL